MVWRTAGIIASGTAVVCCATILHYYYRRCQNLCATAEKYKALRDQERIGRTRAEAKLRQKIITQVVSNGFCFKPIGTLKTLFPDKRGTPRQACLAPATKSTLILNSNVHAAQSLICLDHFSHLWLISVFHENTDAVKANSGGKLSFKSKIRPPRLKGEKVGVFSTRSPHRPNPISLSLVKIEGIDLQKGVIHLSGCDMIDNTPILDIKPYIPRYDANVDARSPSWIQMDGMNNASTDLKVKFTPDVINAISKLSLQSNQQLDSQNDLVECIKQVLHRDIRNLKQNEACYDTIFEVNIASFTIHYLIDSLKNVVLIQSVTPSTE